PIVLNQLANSVFQRTRFFTLSTGERNRQGQKRNSICPSGKSAIRLPIVCRRVLRWPFDWRILQGSIPPKSQAKARGKPMSSFYRGMICENVTIKGDGGTPITAYTAKPAGGGPFPGVVLVHHLPGWSELYIESTRRFAHHGFMAICANLYERAGDGNPDDVAAKVRAEGGIADSQMVGDTEAAVKWMRAQPGNNGKVGVFGSCSGGRHAFIYACQKKDVDACVELWGGRVVMGKEELNEK